MQKRLKEIEELKTQLDELVDAQRMVEELTEKNLNLEEYASELKVRGFSYMQLVHSVYASRRTTSRSWSS